MAIYKAVKRGDLELVNKLLDDNNSILKDSKWLDYNLLNIAIRNNQVNIAKLLINKGCRINRTPKSCHAETPLHNAIRQKFDDIMKMLVDKGASVFAKNRRDETPLHTAIKCGNSIAVDYIIQLCFEDPSINIVDASGLSFFHIACMQGQAAYVLGTLRCGTDINQRVHISSRGEWPGYNALHFAVLHNKKNIVAILLKHGADTCAKSKSESTPIHLAYELKCDEITELILLHDKIKENPVDVDGISHFHIACTINNPSIITKYLKGNIDINLPTKVNSRSLSKFTALHFAVNCECTKVVELLLLKGADFCKKNSDGSTPLHLACYKNYEQIIDLILMNHHRNYNNPVDNYGVSHFHIACTKNIPKVIKGFLKTGIDVNKFIYSHSSFCANYSPLYIAIKYERIEIVKILLKHKADLNARNRKELTLHLACQKAAIHFSAFRTHCRELRANAKKEQEVQALINRIKNNNGYIKIIELLLKHKVDVNVRDDFGRTPLFYTYSIGSDICKSSSSTDVDMTTQCKNIFLILKQNRMKVIRLLLQYGAKLNIADDDGITILHMLADTNSNFYDIEVEIAELFISKGANVNAKDKFNITPLHLAAENGHIKIVEVLLKHNANHSATTSPELATPLHFSTAHFCSCTSRFDVIKLLVENGANLEANLINGKTALHIAASITMENDYVTGLSSIFEDTRMIIDLLLLGCNVNAQDKIGKTPLHYACMHNGFQSVMILLNYGADLNILDNKGLTPMSYCSKDEENDDLYTVFLNHMIKLQIIGFNFNFINLTMLSKLKKKFSKQADEFEKQCMKELDVMKTTKIDCYTSVYDVLWKSSNDMALHIKNDNFRKILVNRYFPCYDFLIKLQSNRGYIRKDLLDSAKDSLNFITGIKFPDSCSEAIFEHLSDQNIKDLIKAKSVVMSIKNQAVICKSILNNKKRRRTK